MTGYTPTTDEVRDLWENSLSHGCANREAKADADWEDERMAAQFDRWLAQVKAEAQVEVLTDVAGSFFARTHDGMPNGRAYNSYSVARIVREVADRIAREAGIETGESRGRKS